MIDARFLVSEGNEVINYLDSSINGLSEEEANRRLNVYGKNVIKEKEPPSVFKIFLDQFKSPLVYLLLFAGLVSFISGEVVDTYIIMAVVLINALVGTYHEVNAIKSLESLKSFVKGKVKVRRDGEIKVIDAELLVPGDIVIIEEGDKIMADIRILESHDLTVNESTLTGESIGVKKTASPVVAKRLNDMKNILFTSTFVMKGKGIGIVIATGNNTVVGKLFGEVKVKDEFPIRKKLERLTKDLTKYVVGGTILLLITTTTLFGYEFEEILELLIAQAVSFIPAGLPIVVTVAIALSAYEMAKKKAVVRKLDAMEAIGGIDYLCIDKTGTVTKNKITLNGIVYKEKVYWLDKDRFDVEDVIKVLVLCNDAKKVGDRYLGDPLDVAILERFEYKKDFELIEDNPFDYEKKMVVKVVKEGNNVYKLIKGSPESVMSISNLSEEEKKRYVEIMNKYAKEGYRIIGIAIGRGRNEEIEFLGLALFEDPVRKEAKETIKRLEKAGIRVMMITGDYKLTAEAVAKKIGLKGKVLDEEELFKMSKEELVKNIEKIGVISRASVEGKMKIIEILREKGYVVAMTGDGVNDSLALINADVGISLASGTDIAKESSDIVLLDDHIDNIYNAVQEGRRSIINVKKTIRYLFSTNFSEVVFLLSFLLSPLLNLNLKFPLTATQILYVNLVTDGLCDVAIAAEKREKELSRHKPSYFKRDYFSKEVKHFILISAIYSLMVLWMIYFLYQGSLKQGTVVFTTLAFLQLFIALSSRKIYPVRDLPNKFLITAIVLSVLIQLFVIYNPFLASLMKVYPLEIWDWANIIIVTAPIFFLQEFAKLRKFTI